MSDKLYKLPMTNVSGGIKGVTNISSGTPLDENNIPTEESAYKFNLTGLYKKGYSPAFFVYIVYNVQETNELVTHNIYVPEYPLLSYKEGIMLFKADFYTIQLFFDKAVNNVVAKGTIFDTITINDDTFVIHIDKNYNPSNITSENESPIRII